MWIGDSAGCCGATNKNKNKLFFFKKKKNFNFANTCALFYARAYLPAARKPSQSSKHIILANHTHTTHTTTHTLTHTMRNIFF